MHLRFLKQFARVGFLSAAGTYSFYQISGRDMIKKVHNSFSIMSINPTTTWDDNYDFRSPASLVKPLQENPSPELENEYNKKLEKQTPRSIRNVILIRHGQYIFGDTDEERKLTEIGKQQATFTGKRLNELAIPIDNVVVSTMTRAQETANLIIKQLPKKETVIERKDCKMLEEGAVFKPSD